MPRCLLPQEGKMHFLFLPQPTWITHWETDISLKFDSHWYVVERLWVGKLSMFIRKVSLLKKCSPDLGSVHGSSPLKIPRWRMSVHLINQGSLFFPFSDHAFFLFHGVLHWTQFVGGVRLRTRRLVWDWLTDLVLKWHISLLPVSDGLEFRDRSILNWRRKRDYRGFNPYLSQTSVLKLVL